MITYSQIISLQVLLYLHQCSGNLVSVTMHQTVGTERCEMPRMLPVDIEFGDVTLKLNLERNEEVDVNVPVYVIKHGGASIVRHSHPMRGFATYQDSRYGASLSLRCMQTQNKGPVFELEGHIYHQGNRYRLVSITQRVRRSAYQQHSQVYMALKERDAGSHDLYNKGRRLLERSVDVTVPQSASRRQRSADPTAVYSIDLVVVLDYAVYQDWLLRNNNDSTATINDLRRYYALIVNGVDLRYKTIVSTKFSQITVRLVGYVIATNAASSTWTESIREINGTREPQINSDTALNLIQDWLKRTANFPQYDHAMFFTGYDLYGVDSGFRFNYTTGLAFISTLCKKGGRSVSIVEDHGGFQSVGTAAHELGHSMGSDHDGANNSCNSNDRFIMANASHNPTTNTQLNPWKFSPCSITYFESYIDKILPLPEGECLTGRLNVSVDVVNTTGMQPGQLYSPDTLCRQIYGNSSYMCRLSNLKPVDICQSLFCKDPSTEDTCLLVNTPTGMLCGNQSWCINGQCVYSTDAPTANPSCVFGDQTGKVFNEMTCAELVRSAPAFCYGDSFLARCCASCAAVKRTTNGCEYGDKVLNCDVAYCRKNIRDSDGTLYDSTCCGTCECNNSTICNPPTVEPCSQKDVCLNSALGVNNRSCHSYIQEDPTRCYTAGIKSMCCASCQCARRPENPSDCWWGDRQTPTNCMSVRNLGAPCSAKNTLACCETCYNMSFTTTTTITTATATTTITTATSTITTATTTITTATTTITTATTTKPITRTMISATTAIGYSSRNKPSIILAHLLATVLFWCFLR